MHARELNRLTGILVALVACLFWRGEVRGQCEPVWRSGLWVPNGPVWDMCVWDADGEGPQTPSVVAVGQFVYAGTQLVNHIAAYDPVTEQWSPLGIGVPMVPAPNTLVSVRSIATGANGDIIVSGSFMTAGGVSARRIARYNTATGWRPLGLGLNDHAESLLVMPNGDVVASGRFTEAGGQLVSGVARWDGMVWAPLGNGFGPQGPANVLMVTRGGELIAGGGFGVVRWNGMFWTNFGIVGDASPGGVRTIVELPNGDLIVGGRFEFIQGVFANKIARWNGTSWTQLGLGVQGGVAGGFVSGLAVMPNREIIIAGSFSAAGGIPANNIARWNGSSWSPLGAGIIGVLNNFFNPVLLVMPSGDLFAGGEFEIAGGVPSAHFAHWGPPSGCSTLACDSLDFNNDQASFDPQDIEAFLSVYGEGPCIPATAECNDVDFNNDGSLFDPCDINAFLLVYAEGPCTFCGV